jgi:serine/threonine protein kinase
MHDHPCSDLSAVRGYVQQIAKGLRAFHPKEIIHRDLKPENIMIDRHNMVRIIDFGSVRVAGIAENGFGGRTSGEWAAGRRPSANSIGSGR